MRSTQEGKMRSTQDHSWERKTKSRRARLLQSRECRLAHPHNSTRSASFGPPCTLRAFTSGERSRLSNHVRSMYEAKHLVCAHSLSQHLHEGVLLLVRAGLGLRHEEGAVVVQRDDVARLKVLHAQVHPLSRLHLVRDLTTITITTTRPRGREGGLCLEKGG